MLKGHAGTGLLLVIMGHAGTDLLLVIMGQAGKALLVLVLIGQAGNDLLVVLLVGIGHSILLEVVLVDIVVEEEGAIGHATEVEEVIGQALLLAELEVAALVVDPEDVDEVEGASPELVTLELLVAFELVELVFELVLLPEIDVEVDEARLDDAVAELDGIELELVELVSEDLTLELGDTEVELAELVLMPLFIIELDTTEVLDEGVVVL